MMAVRNMAFTTCKTELSALRAYLLTEALVFLSFMLFTLK